MLQDLCIVSYCHPHCTPLQSITRLSQAEAFALAEELSQKNQGTAFFRFADFIHYYPKRIRVEKWLHDRFLALGGEPETEHPLYFVLHKSDYLNQWFDRGEITSLPLRAIDSKHISFTFGDSMSKMDKPERRDPFRLEELYRFIDAAGDIETFLGQIKDPYTYIEAQLWSDTQDRRPGHHPMTGGTP